MLLFLCIAFYYVRNSKIVYEKHLLYHSDKVYQVKFHGHSSQMLLMSLEIRAVDSGGGKWGPSPHLESVPPHFTFGPPVVAYIQYCILKMCPPPSGFWPPLLLNTGDGPARNKEHVINLLSKFLSSSS